MKNFVIILVLAFSGCRSGGMISADAINNSLRRVVREHATYVAADDALTPLQKTVATRDGTLLLDVLTEAQKAAAGL